MMWKKIRKSCLIIIVSLSLIGLSSSSAISRGTVWRNGIVTKVPWTEKYQHIEIDEAKYTFMPQGVRIERRFKTPLGSWGTEKISVNNIHVGDKVEILIQGRRIYEMNVIEE